MTIKKSDLLLFIAIFAVGALAGRWLLPSADQDDPPQVLQQEPLASQPVVKPRPNLSGQREIVRENEMYRKKIAQLEKQLGQVERSRPSEIDQVSSPLAIETFINQGPRGGPGLSMSDRLKSSLARQLKPVTNELRQVLALSPEQHADLVVLLEQKAATDIDATTSLFNRAPILVRDGGSFEINSGSGSDALGIEMQGVTNAVALPISTYRDISEQSELELTRRELLDENQQNYEQQLALVLTASQMDEYQRFEQDKYNQKALMGMTVQAKMMMHNIRSLQDYQKEEINRFIHQYRAEQAAQSEIKIGTYGTPFTSASQAQLQNFMPSLKLQLEQILTQEQQEQYNSRKNRIGTRIESFGD